MREDPPLRIHHLERVEPRSHLERRACDVGAGGPGGVEDDERAAGSVRLERAGVDLVRERHETLPDELVGDLLHLVEAGAHLIVDGVDGAPADGVVRVAGQEDPPRLVEERRGVSHARRLEVAGPDRGIGLGGAETLRPRHEGLRPALEQPLAEIVPLLDPDAAREHPGKQVVALGAAELPPHDGETHAPLLYFFADGREVGRERRDEPALPPGRGLAHERRDLWLRLVMVGSVQKEPMRHRAV